MSESFNHSQSEEQTNPPLTIRDEVAQFERRHVSTDSTSSSKSSLATQIREGGGGGEIKTTNYPPPEPSICCEPLEPISETELLVTACSSPDYDTFTCSSGLTSQTPSVPSLRPIRKPSMSFRRLTKHLTKETILRECIEKPISYIPPVILGTLLNVLDGLSYGMILFPLGTAMFSELGPAGLSMFYVSCIISQLVYSLGGSRFKAGVGSEMIEVVPFFHAMAFTIMQEVGEDRPREVIATTILAFALSSMVTGVVFFLLGYTGLGALIGFFPRHILVGCVGGVGWFLVVTGIEVSARLGSSLEYNLPMLKQLLQPDMLLKWSIPVVLAVILMAVERTVHHPLIMPSYFIVIFGLFHVFILLVPSWSLDMARAAGWIFEAPSVNEPWWSFYKLYDFRAVQYDSLLRTVPAMLALTFFGLLHVPINVPALAVSTKEDHVDVDRELIAHGISNFVSGMCGSIQNYLVYTNSLLFIRSGANSRLAGVMLAMATAGVMVSGPVVIGFIPVMVVGALIFLLGFELLIEAVVDTWGRLSKFEYFTVVAIVVTMGAWDFVYGILIGIMLACVSFVIQASRTSAIKASYTGVVARSTVRRHFMQQKFLGEVGDQIYVLKLSGYIFFGTIVRIEQAVRDLLDERYFSKRPIRYLIIDIEAVTDIDFSASEAFARMKRLLDSKGVFMLLSGATEDVSAIRGLKAIRLLASDPDSEHPVRLFSKLNMALEWCENEFLGGYYRQREAYHPSTNTLQIPGGRTSSPGIIDLHYGASPRAISFRRAVENAAREDFKVVSKWQHFRQPLPIMMQVFQGLSGKTEDFWFQLVPYFQREEISKGAVVYKSENEATGFYIVESGILRADYDLEQGTVYESILAGTTCGELPFFSDTKRTATVVAEADSVVWKLDRKHWEALKVSKPNGMELANELLVIALRLTVERFTSITAYVMISSS
jgi:SulP family sulfate permease